MVSVVLVGIWFALAVYNIYKWMIHRPPNFPPGKNFCQYELLALQIQSYFNQVNLI